MEIVLTTVPVFGHCLLVAELPFEAFHQSLKRNLSKNTTSKSHLSAMKCVLFSDWFRRVATEIAKVDIDGKYEAQVVEVAKQIIPFGHYLFSDGLHHDDVIHFRENVLKHIKDELLGPLSSFLRDEYAFSMYPDQVKVPYNWNTSTTTQAKPMIDLKISAQLNHHGKNMLLNFSLQWVTVPIIQSLFFIMYKLYS